MERGTVSSPDRFKQSILFEGLKYGTVTPTDIDGFLDFGNKLFVMVEAKMEGTQFQEGQKLAFSRLAQASRVPAIYLFSTHNVPVHQDVYLAQCDVSHVFRAPHWTWQEQPRPRLKVWQYVTALRVEFRLEAVNPKVFMPCVKSEPPLSMKRDLPMLDVNKISW